MISWLATHPSLEHRIRKLVPQFNLNQRPGVATESAASTPEFTQSSASADSQLSTDATIEALASVVAQNPSVRHDQLHALDSDVAAQVQACPVSRLDPLAKIHHLMRIAPNLRHLTPINKSWLAEQMFAVIHRDDLIEPWEIAGYQVAVQLIDHSRINHPKPDQIRQATETVVDYFFMSGKSCGLDAAKALAVLNSQPRGARENLFHALKQKKVVLPNTDANQQAVSLALKIGLNVVEHD